MQAVFASRGDRIAAVVIEPIMGNCGSIPATTEYLRFLKSLCGMNGSLLIFDEVKTGFRVARGGAQELLNVHADLTTYAKALGNGYPIAAFGGRSDVMDVISTAADGVVHGGTYTANMIGLSAANATLSILRDTDALKTVAQVGKRVMGVLAEAFDCFDLPYVFTGHSSMFGVHFMAEEPANYRDWKKSDSRLYRKFARHLIAAGVMLEPDSREPWFICEAHASIDFDWLSAVTHESLEAALRSE
jgi:glutamate-1-semialdehyde 2,1-aminomutase